MSRWSSVLGVVSIAGMVMASCTSTPTPTPLPTAAAVLAPTATSAPTAAPVPTPSPTPPPTATATTGPVPQRALILGGGGEVGLAWETGIIKGLKDVGVDLTRADLIVGTSAGALLGTEIRLGQSVDGLYDTLLATPSSPAATPGEAAFDQAYVQETSQMIGRATQLTPELRIEVGKRALAATKVFSEDTRVQGFARRIGNPREWPSQPLKLAAGDVADGSLRFFDKTQGVAIEQALAASNALPGFSAPITIGERRYMDGFVGGANIDAAAGAGFILVLTPFGPMPAELQREIDLARSKGSQVLNVSPDADSRAAMGQNPLDLSKRAPTVQAAARQAGTVAAQVRAFWDG